jgi:hypothetical protein
LKRKTKMNDNPVEGLLSKFALAKPPNRDHVLSAACERAADRARERSNAMLKAAFATLVVVVVAGVVLDATASRRLDRMLRDPISADEVNAAARELARELAEELDGDDKAQIEKYFARSLSRSAFSYVGFGQGAARQDGDVWMKHLIEGGGQWNNQTG